MDAHERAFKILPQEYHTLVADLLDKLQMWDMRVFINITSLAETGTFPGDPRRK